MRMIQPGVEPVRETWTVIASSRSARAKYTCLQTSNTHHGLQFSPVSVKGAPKPVQQAMPLNKHGKLWVTIWIVEKGVLFVRALRHRARLLRPRRTWGFGVKYTYILSRQMSNQYILRRFGSVSTQGLQPPTDTSNTYMRYLYFLPRVTVCDAGTATLNSD